MGIKEQRNVEILLFSIIFPVLQDEMSCDNLHPSKVSCLPLVLSFFFVQSQPSKKLCRDQETIVADFRNRASRNEPFEYLR